MKLTREQIGQLKDALDQALSGNANHQYSPAWFQVLKARADLAFLTDGEAGRHIVGILHGCPRAAGGAGPLDP